MSDISTASLERSLAIRRKLNPHKYFVPNGKVEEFIQMVGGNKVFVSLLSAANGVGKTAAGTNIIAHFMYGQSGNKWFEGLELFDKFPFAKQGRIASDPTTIKETIVPELKKWLPYGRYKHDKAGKNYDSIWKTDTGWKFDLMTYEQSSKEYESATLGWAWFDEPPPFEIFKATVARMRTGGIIFITATPLTGSAWMYDHILRYKPVGKDSKDLRQRDYIEADVEANCIGHGIRGRLKHSDIEKMIAEYSEDDKQARIYGKFHHLVGIIFKRFDRKVHVIKPFKITKEDYVVVEALDPHPRNPDAVMWVAIDRKGNKYVIDELYDTFTTSQLSTEIKNKADRYRVVKRIADPAAFVEDKHQINPTESTLAGELYNKYDLDYEKATKVRARSDRRIKDALDYELKGKEMLIAPELYFFSTCTRSIWEMEHYQWDEWRGVAADRKSPMEKPMDKDDHEIENLGRILVQEIGFTPMRKSNRSSGIGVISNKKMEIYD